MRISLIFIDHAGKGFSYFYDGEKVRNGDREVMVRVSDSLGAAIEYQYDCLNQRTSERSRINEYFGRKTKYTYDAVERLIQTEEYKECYDLMIQDWKWEWKKKDKGNCFITG